MPSQANPTKRDVSPKADREGFETVQELRCDLRWKAACGLGLHDMAFDPSLPTYFRRRLRRSADPTRIFTRVKEVMAATGVLKGKRRRTLDSTGHSGHRHPDHLRHPAGDPGGPRRPGDR
ncbi:transposase [Streptomyces virginiae]